MIENNHIVQMSLRRSKRLAQPWQKVGGTGQVRPHEIYMTEERWDHALRFHSELEDHLDDVLDTLKTGLRGDDNG